MKKLKQKHAKKPGSYRRIAVARIEHLFEEAHNIFKKNKALSKRYITLARRIAMKYKVSIPSKLKRRFCKKCGSFLMPSLNCRVRLQKGKMVYLCMECKNIARVGYKKGKK